MIPRSAFSSSRGIIEKSSGSSRSALASRPKSLPTSTTSQVTWPRFDLRLDRRVRGVLILGELHARQLGVRLQPGLALGLLVHAAERDERERHALLARRVAGRRVPGRAARGSRAGRRSRRASGDADASAPARGDDRAGRDERDDRCPSMHARTSFFGPCRGIPRGVAPWRAPSSGPVHRRPQRWREQWTRFAAGPCEDERDARARLAQRSRVHGAARRTALQRRDRHRRRPHRGRRRRPRGACRRSARCPGDRRGRADHPARVRGRPSPPRLHRRGAGRGRRAVPGRRDHRRISWRGSRRPPNGRPTASGSGPSG